MLNIISKSYCRRFTSGPKKVVDNLIKGLDRLCYPYVVNRRLDACKRLWIHDDLEALKLINTLPEEIKVVVGPNLVTMPRNVPTDVDLSKTVYLHPSEWAKDFWLTFGFSSCPVEAWPTGIDTGEFQPSGEPRTKVMAYFKQRLPEELVQLEQLLKAKRINYEVLLYPTYTERQYKRLLATSRYGIWLGRQESQGIALQEAMAAGLPLLIWDIKSYGHWLASPKEMGIFTPEENAYTKATSAEYFDETCGMKVKDFSELSQAIDTMEKSWQSFKPREYILSHLSLEKQARELVEIYHMHFGLTYEQGLQEQVLRKGDWVNRSLKVRGLMLAKDVAKTIIRTLKQVKS